MRRPVSERELLKKIKGVGTLIALTFLLTLENPHRFRKSRDMGCYLGLQPGRGKSADCDPQRWGLKLAERGGRNGRKLAIGATATKLAVLLHHLWMNDFAPRECGWKHGNSATRRG